MKYIFNLIPLFLILCIAVLSRSSTYSENLIADEYQSALKEFMKNVRDKAHDASADYQLVTTDTPLEPLLREFLTARLPKAKH